MMKACIFETAAVVYMTSRPRSHGFVVLCFVMVPFWVPGVCISTVYPKKYAHGFVVLCFVVVMQLFIMNSHEVFIHIHQGCYAGTGAIVRLPQFQWSKPDGYGKISQCITTTKHSKAKTVCIFLGVYCIYPLLVRTTSLAPGTDTTATKLVKLPHGSCVSTHQQEKRK